MIRTIIEIDREKCNGCGLCVDACHEGALGMVDGKAHLLRDDYCDGLGDCLPTCPVDAISFVEREAAAYDEAAVMSNQVLGGGLSPTGCPGVRIQEFDRDAKNTCDDEALELTSQLNNWPVQIKLAPTKASYFENAHLLIAADCAAYAYPAFHNDHMREKATLIACPKLDAVNYSEKLAEIFSSNTIKSVTIARMEVPCCGGLEHAVRAALEASGKSLPLNIITISVDGRVLD